MAKRTVSSKSKKEKELPEETEAPGKAPRDVVIVESPGKVKTINKILGSKYKVMASFGHVRDLPTGKRMPDKTPVINLTTFEPQYVLSEKKIKVVEDILDAVSKGGDLYLCSDPDREGEAISFHLLEVIKEKLGILDSKVHRVTFNEITEKAIKDAFEAPRKLDMKLVDSQQARRVVDRIVGYDLTGLLYDKILTGLTGGRVQSVAVRLVAEREKEIKAFVPTEYWTVGAVVKCNGSEFNIAMRSHGGIKIASSADNLLSIANGDAGFVHLKSEDDAARMQEALMDSEYAEVVSYGAKEYRESPYPPFITSSLQQAAANVLGFDTKRTMAAAQRLYEGVEIGGEPTAMITYMRTDSVNVSVEAQQSARGYVNSLFGKEYLPDEPPIYKSKKGAQEAHECVRPTHPEINPGVLATNPDKDLFKLYELIWKRFIASQMSPATYDSTTVEVGAFGNKKTHENILLVASGRRIKFEGWRKVSGYDPSKDSTLPPMKVGDKAIVASASKTQHFTEPPSRFNEASLIRVMESEGIGRPSTYSSILQTIQQREYVKKVGTGGKAPLRATYLGMAVTDSLVGHMSSVMELGFTRDLEEKLDLIADGEETYKRTLKDFYKGFAADMAEAKANMPSLRGGEKTDVKCPACGGEMTKRLSKGGQFLKCNDEACKTTLNVNDDGLVEAKPPDVPTGIKCDACGGDVILAKGRFGEYLCCEKYKDKKCDFTMKFLKGRVPARKFKAIPTEVECEECAKRGKASKMVIRVASRKKVPAPFLSCPAFPKCRHAIDLPDELKSKGDDAMMQFEANRAKDAKDVVKFKDFIEEHEKGVD